MKFSKAKILLAGTLSVGGVFVGGFSATHAAVTPPASCGFAAADFKKIADIQNNPNLSYSDELNQELALRKQLVGEVINCAKSDALSLQAKLKATTVSSASATLQAQLGSKLTDATNFYDIESAKLDGSGIAGTQAIARELLAWRSGSYAPLAAEVNNFMLWAGNQDLFDAAATRLDQTRRAVAFLESASGNAELEAAMSDAESSYATADQQNKGAKTALAQFLPADQSLAAIKQSLASLADTYQKFSVVSDLIRKLLPQ